MRIGMALYASNPFSPLPMESLRYVIRSLKDAASSRHELVFLPQTYICASPEEEQAMNEELVRSCDVIVGSASVSVPETRHRIGSDVPIVSLTLGVLSRGGFGVDVQVPYLTSNDVLVVNCTSDRELARKFFTNAQVRLLPFAIDGAQFYPLDEAERRTAREKLGFRERDRILVYSGRTTLQKNVHTLLKVFSVVQRVVPDACLVIAGPVVEHGAPEFGVAPVRLANTIDKLVAGLGIPPGRVVMMSQVPAPRLRELYGIADVKVNLSLHHDENFGLAQVEAMACGTPVIGTAWGGLKDTIVDGVSGYRVSTSLTPLGVKASWWEAVNRIVALLRDPAARERFRDSCVRHASERYSQARYESTLLEILSDTVRGRGRPPEPLRPSAFARELWGTCHPRTGPRPPFQRGPRSYELYQEMIGPIAGATAEAVPAGEAPAPGQVLTLAAPVTRDEDGRLRSNDPMYPFEIDVPSAHALAFEAILSVLREEPAITVERLCGHPAAGGRGASHTLAWILDRGLLLRTRPVDGWLPPGTIDRRMSEPFFRIERPDHRSVDFFTA